MNILVCRWDIFVYPDILDTLKNQGHLFDVLDFSAIKMNDDEIISFSKILEDKIFGINSTFQNNFPADNSPEKNLSAPSLSEEKSEKAKKYDAVFSVNYFSYIAEVCHRLNIQYICYNVDSPLLNMQHPSINYKTNHIYTFDSKEAKDFNNNGIYNVYYMPLCTNVERVQTLIKNSHHLSDLTDNDFIKSKKPKQTAYENISIKNTNLKQTENYTTTKSEYPKSYGAKSNYDISFVGNLYDKNRYDDTMHILPDYLCGYMDAAIEAQLNVNGGNLLKNMLTPEIIDMLSQYTDVKASSQSNANLKFHFATSVLAHKTAAKMRIMALNNLAMKYPGRVHFFTTSDTSPLFPALVTHKGADYFTKAPFVFAHSKININMTAPNIETGIPLRVFDILGAGGFLITDWREDLKDCFTIGKDLEIYNGLDDLLEKTDYYLKHDEKRIAIARHGLDTVRKKHTYNARLKEIFSL